MSGLAEHDEAREIARGFAGALEAALAPAAEPGALEAAREAAGILGLDAVGRLLGAFEPHAGRAWPAELGPVRDRLLRMAARAARGGDLAEFRERAGELEGLAAEAGAIEWTTRPAGAGRMATLSALMTLDEVPFVDDASRLAARRARLEPPVAAALRAALDWLAGPGGPARPLAARAEDSVFEVCFDAVDPTGLGAAESVIAGVGGSLGPALAPGAHGWVIRVPAVSPHDHYMMFEQGRLRLAVPWHAVLRLQVLPAAGIPDLAAADGLEVLTPLSGLAASSDEVPVIAVAHGLRRAWLVADRLIWRLAADAVEPSAGMRADGFERAVETAEGDRFAVVPVERLLSRVAPIVAPFDADSLEPLDAPAPVAAHSPAGGPAGRTTTPAPAVADSPAPGAPADAVAAAPAPGVPAAAVAAAPAPGAPADAVVAAPAPGVPAAAAPTPAAPAPPVEPTPAPVPVPAPAPAREVATAPPPAPQPDRPPAPAFRSHLPPTPAWPRAPRIVTEILGAGPPAAPRAAAPAPPRAVEPLPAVAAFHLDAGNVEPIAGPRPPARALVAEDSFAARVFLVRLLEQKGFEVAAVERAADVDRLIEEGPWGAVFLDVELPDARGTAFLAAVRARLEGAAAPALFAALTRDEEDEAAAARAGIAVVLRKPVAREVLEYVLGAAGFRGAERA